MILVSDGPADGTAAPIGTAKDIASSHGHSRQAEAATTLEALRPRYSTRGDRRARRSARARGLGGGRLRSQGPEGGDREDHRCGRARARGERGRDRPRCARGCRRSVARPGARRRVSRRCDGRRPVVGRPARVGHREERRAGCGAGDRARQSSRRAGARRRGPSRQGREHGARRRGTTDLGGGAARHRAEQRASRRGARRVRARGASGAGAGLGRGAAQDDRGADATEGRRSPCEDDAASDRGRGAGAARRRRARPQARVVAV